MAQIPLKPTFARQKTYEASHAPPAMPVNKMAQIPAKPTFARQKTYEASHAPPAMPVNKMAQIPAKPIFARQKTYESSDEFKPPSSPPLYFRQQTQNYHASFAEDKGAFNMLIDTFEALVYHSVRKHG